MTISVLDSTGSPQTVNTINDLIAMVAKESGGNLAAVATSVAALAAALSGGNLKVDIAAGSALNVNGRAAAGDCAPMVLSDEDLAAVEGKSVAEFETVAASQTDQIIGPTGAAGDYLSHVTVFPGTAGCGAVTIKDNATTIGTFAGGGTTALPTLAPFTIYIGAKSSSGAWKITTGTNVTCVAVGDFT